MFDLIQQLRSKVFYRNDAQLLVNFSFHYETSFIGVCISIPCYLPYIFQKNAHKGKIKHSSCFLSYWTFSINDAFENLQWEGQKVLGFTTRMYECIQLKDATKYEFNIHGCLKWILEII